MLLTTVLEYSRKSGIAFRSQSETVVNCSVFRTTILLQICFSEIRMGDLKHLCKISCQITKNNIARSKRIFLILYLFQGKCFQSIATVHI